LSVVNEAAKLSAFARRDLKIMLSYRVAAVAGFVGLAAQALVFSFIGRLVDPSRLPSYGATHTTYMAFVTIGIGLNMVVLLMLHQVATAMRTEQMIGTLESLLATPTAVSTLQAGSAVFELLYVPIRFGLFVGVVRPGVRAALPSERNSPLAGRADRVLAIRLGVRADQRRRDHHLSAWLRRPDDRRHGAWAVVGSVLSPRASPSLAADDRGR